MPLSKPAPIINKIMYEKLSNFLLKEKGFSFSSYRSSCISRRITSRLVATRSRSISDYIRRIKKDPDELNTLYNALTINVSSFFRNPEVFDFLADHILPEIVKQKTQAGNKFINIWSVGCSTGEEPYSLIFLLEKFLKLRLKKFRINISAIDIDPKAIEFAKNAVYPKNRLTGLDPRIIRTCFTRSEDKYRVKDIFRDMIDFSIQNILDFKPVKTVFDLILCRNMLIYFSNENHLKTYDHFRQHLSKEGYLILGKAEIMLQCAQNDFDQLSINNRVYQKIK